MISIDGNIDKETIIFNKYGKIIERRKGWVLEAPD